MNIKGKTAVVTGGAVRIGRAICESLASAGCNIVVHYNKSSTDAHKLVSELKKQDVKAWAVKGDLSDVNNCSVILDDAIHQAGNIDILVNNAAVFHKDTISGTTPLKLENEIAVNFMAPAELSRCFAGRFKGRQWRIVNLLDRRITSSGSDCVPYVISKKMLAEFTKTAALEFAPAITVNGVAPGAVLAPPGKGKAYIKDLAGNIPTGKRVTVYDIAQAILFLLESDAITGQIIYVDGGQNLLG